MTVLSVPTRAAAPVATRRRILVRPSTELTRMTRYRGGTYSHTADRIVFDDGTSARTDLIRLNPNLQAYSLDFTGTAPHHLSPYRLSAWSALTHLDARVCEAAVEWIVRHSFPMRSTAELSEQLRQAGYPLGPANINEHEAIAGTQAAIWHLTNGLNLDTRPLNVPIAAHREPGPVITFEFDGQPQLGGYSLWADSDTAVVVKLQKSINGVDWQDISGSQMSVSAGRGRHKRTLGVGSTLSASSHGRGGSGYRYYRLVAHTLNGSDGSTPTIDHVRFWLTGARHYRNADRIVHLYNYLLAGARKAGQHTQEPQLVDTRATVESDLVGPFQVRIPLTLNASEGHTLVDADGFVIEDTIAPGSDFYLRRAPGTTTATLTATTPQHTSPKVLIGVAHEQAPPAHERFTPVALTMPAHVAIQFDISWDCDCRTDTLEDADEHR